MKFFLVLCVVCLCLAGFHMFASQPCPQGMAFPLEIYEVAAGDAPAPGKLRAYFWRKNLDWHPVTPQNGGVRRIFCRYYLAQTVDGTKSKS
jgi:hypothetical protein